MYYLFATLFLFITFMSTLMIGYGPIISSFYQSQHVNIYQFLIDVFEEKDDDGNRIRDKLELRTEAITYSTGSENTFFIDYPDVPDGHKVDRINYLFLNTPFNVGGRGGPDMNLTIPMFVDRERPKDQKYRFFDQKFESIYFPDDISVGVVEGNNQIIKKGQNYYDFGDIEADIRVPQLKLYLGYLYAYCEVEEKDNIEENYFDSNIEFADGRMIVNTQDFLWVVDTNQNKLHFLSEDIDLEDDGIYSLSDEDGSDIDFDDLDDQPQLENTLRESDKIEIEFDDLDGLDGLGYEIKLESSDDTDKIKIDLYDQKIHFQISEEHLDYGFNYKFDANGDKLILETDNLEIPFAQDFEEDGMRLEIEDPLIGDRSVGFEVENYDDEDDYHLRSWDNRFVFLIDNYNNLMLDMGGVERSDQDGLTPNGDWDVVGDIEWSDIILKKNFESMGSYETFDLADGECSIEGLPNYGTGSFELRGHDYKD
ncbi:hypothetical protein [Candidatus Absconditicoccus praedator]|uniref:hypothetical protein n=1 Tax=Candidatus Absconditicoccus praedator TaxID=2735562 RepID=UPI001E60B3CC|nr:hypothetical protein [Candidatus Absconditicoccus praedator]UFX83329.1 hypothetical protein HLG78_04340 [Candidatus Absconditicoccus praedator]